jgi:transposase
VLVNAQHVKNVQAEKQMSRIASGFSICTQLACCEDPSVPMTRSVRSVPYGGIAKISFSLATIHLQHMQKALDQMNLQIHPVISDLSGATGLAIVDAILAGERDPQKLVKLRDWRIKASEETIRKSLVGDYREEHLFVLRQSLDGYRKYQKLICDSALEVKRRMTFLPSKVDPLEEPLGKERNPRKTPLPNRATRLTR